ncbi:DUF502 domain-containing protein [candidate division KSB1 bacterium]
MKRIKSFLKTSILGGLIVVLPATITFIVLKWIFDFITGLIQPLTTILVSNSDIQKFIADIIVIIFILASCFFIGVAIRTKLGKWFYREIENRIFKAAPGYSLIKEAINQFLGRKKTPLSTVALVNIFQNETLATAFVTDTHEDGSYTVFIPTSPNPTSGNIYHLKSEFVHVVDISVQDAMRSVISFGAGSSKIKEILKKNS